MRLGIVLAATGAAVAAWAVAAAQDSFDGRSFRPAGPAGARTNHYFSRNGETSRPTAVAKPAPVPGVRNYYEQLFAEPQAAEPEEGVRTAGGSEADSASLINADYDRTQGRPAAGTIQPVSGQRLAFRSGETARPAASKPPAATKQAAPTGRPAAQTRPPAGSTQAAVENPFLQTAGEADETPQFEESELQEAVAVEPEAESEVETAGPAPQVPFDLAPQSESAAAEEETPAFGFGSPQTAGTAARKASSRGELSAAPQYTSEPVATETALETAPAEDSVGRLAAAHMGGPAAVEVRWEKVSEITVGRECRCELVVKNTGAGAAGEVAVEAFFPRSVRLVSADPKPTAAADHLTWTIPALAAGAERRISVSLVPSEQGDLQVSAFVRYTEAAATTLAVREPMLEVSVNGPPEAALGETVSQTITISNPGTGTSEDVQVEAILPPGLEHAKGSRLAMPIGSLAPGQSHVIRLALFATQGGSHEVRVRATAGELLRHDAATTVLVAAPSLKVSAEGPGLRYVGRDATYRVRITNDGAAIANNVRVTQTVPDGFSFANADNGGRFEPGQSQVVWYVGSVAAGESVELAAELTAAKVGTHRHLVSVFGEGGTKADAVVETAVDGTASLVVEVIDLDDPVEVGAETAYEIRVRNEGTKAASNVAVSCQVPAGVATLSARGPTQPRGEKGLLTFPAVGELEPGKTALYRVVVRGTAAGRHRFRVRLTSDSIEEPLVHEELTHYYAD